MGDSSDNIPGVKGIGAKGAAGLLHNFHSLNGIYENIDKIASKRTQELLKIYKEDAYRSLELVRLREDLLEDFNLQDCQMPHQNPLLKITESLKVYEINSVLKKILSKDSAKNLYTYLKTQQKSENRRILSHKPPLQHLFTFKRIC